MHAFNRSKTRRHVQGETSIDIPRFKIFWGKTLVCRKRKCMEFKCIFTPIRSLQTLSGHSHLALTYFGPLCNASHLGNPCYNERPIHTLALTHWGRVTHICVSKLASIVSDNGLWPVRRQAIIWTNAGILLIGPLGTNLSEMLIEIHTFSFKKIHLKMSSGKWRPFCLGLNVLIQWTVKQIALEILGIGESNRYSFLLILQPYVF